MAERDALCAPGVQYMGGSCITMEILEDMIRTFNETNESRDRIKIDRAIINMKEYNPITYKKKLVELIGEKMRKYNCTTQTCWITLPFFKRLSDPEKTETLLHNTFKPEGPKYTNEWLSTVHIDNVCVQYEKYYRDFKFIGALPCDYFELDYSTMGEIDFSNLKAHGAEKVGIIFNLDRHNQPGSHWVALYCDIGKSQVYYIDSVGTYPKKEINKVIKYFKDNCKKINGTVDVQINRKSLQNGTSECGVYAISFILRLLDGETYDDIMNNTPSDEEIWTCRAIYFR